jgi:hypothetical protein
MSFVSHENLQKCTQLETLSIDTPVGNVFLDPKGLGIRGMAHLLVTFHSSKVVTQYTMKPMILALVRAVHCVGRSNANFVLSYDFRRCRPTPLVAQALETLHREQADAITRQLKAIALLVTDNLFTIASKSTIGSFMKESCLPKCPHAIVHSESTATKFFQELSHYSSPDPGFVSVVGVREKSDSKQGQVETCVATLLPLRRRASMDSEASEVASVAQHATMVHTLENGDMRIIQSAATDVMLRQLTPPAEPPPPLDVSFQNVSSIEAGVEVVVPPQKRESATDKNEAVSSSDLLELQALKYRCPVAKLQQFVGTHFHIAELTIDADAASHITRGPCDERRAAKAARAASASPKAKVSKKMANEPRWVQCLGCVNQIFGIDR